MRRPRSLVAQGLVARAAKGDPEAMQGLARGFLPCARRIARALGAGEHSDDIAQLATLQVLRRCGSLRDEHAFTRWAERICARTTLRFLADERRRHRLIDPQIAPTEVVEMRTPDATTTTSLPRTIEDYLAQLPSIHRTALIMKHVLGYEVAEIADITGASVNTVKARLYHGRKSAREAMQADQAALERRQRRSQGERR